MTSKLPKTVAGLAAAVAAVGVSTYAAVQQPSLAEAAVSNTP